MARVHGESRTEYIKPEVTLLSYPLNAVGTVVSMWVGSRFNETIDPSDLQKLYECLNPRLLPDRVATVGYKLRGMYPEYSDISHHDMVSRLFEMVDNANLPPLDSIYFTFQIDDATVSFREQLVRSRLPQNFWTQTSRTADLTMMDVSMMESVSAAGPDAEDIYRSAVNKIRRSYEELIDMGVPSEDIRLMPSNMTHRIYWMVPYRTLKSVLSKRMSWIAQSGLWAPIIHDILVSIRSIPGLRVFSESLGVPSDVLIKDGQVISHRYDIENEDRYYGRDPLPVDPLWLAYRVTHNNEALSYPEPKNPYQYLVMKYNFSHMWNDDVLDILGWDRNDVLKLGPYDPFIPTEVIDKFKKDYGM